MEKFVDKGGKENVVIEQIQKVEQLDRKRTHKTVMINNLRHCQ